jgi:hypothetical protein
VPGVLDTCLDDSFDHGPESGPVRKLSLPQGGGGVATFCQLALERPGLEIKTSSRCWRESSLLAVRR